VLPRSVCIPKPEKVRHTCDAGSDPASNLRFDEGQAPGLATQRRLAASRSDRDMFRHLCIKLTHYPEEIRDEIEALLRYDSKLQTMQRRSNVVHRNEQ